MHLNYLTAHQLHDMLVNGDISSEELTLAVFNRIEQVDERIRAFITVTREQALQQAKKVDQARLAGDKLPPLAGIPVAVKDNMCTRGIRTTCASKILYQFVPPYNATVIDRLNKEQMVLVGKTNLDEFAMGSSCENSAFFPTSNPWDETRVPGGSSGGSAAAVASGETVLALGSDTGGSIRQPASFCGVVGMKPTYGAVSRYGLVAYASSLDQIGPFARDVTDCALLLNAICGHDPLDSTSAPYDQPDYKMSLNGEIKGMKIGVPREMMGDGIDAGVREVIEKAIDVLTGLGAFIEETTLPHTEYALPAYYLIAPAEASSNLARYDGVAYGYRSEKAQDMVDMYMKSRSEGFGPEVKRRIMLGTYALSAGYYDAYYNQALKVRTLVKNDFDRAFNKYDLLLGPVAPCTAFKRGEKIDDPMQMYLVDICTLSVNLAGIPAISVPAGMSGNLPVGLHLMGKPFGEEDILRAAYAFEQNTDHHLKFP
ncbi:aspartyl/glutamyl-tRNA(Asn/Gln) amidotransferase subunit A [Desulfotomaculum arcticum]|uniref:Glutamyl-tRNA(Gln) amidotransferase subunit A n=1 Tax=Desulfotruncus arcticus DSM 17038 TaxID=1121424 RepID=A0A1I2N5Z4_9FIRM|nr:Asp-tRNA(Asn)/Glu-tRNA(Gln) amidotransferase subunit GatA [Desulfotruncus arcticus]SFF96936.1 aspartyl/glutamyl-tRNA(Asn/Gln) amidotransferase subunit A [Desulfotomaculum arcticum] [Desulfotruncus arcticus DSM 17038]